MATSERIVYFLGAGFSASVGLPLMANFYNKAQDMQATDHEKYSYISQILDEVRSISHAKNYYNSDLLNIEEIFSVLETMAWLNGEDISPNFRRLVVDVIRFYTPEFSVPEGIQDSARWGAYIFGRPTDPYSMMGAFVANLLNLIVQDADPKGVPDRRFRILMNQEATAHYDVITVNYDHVLDQIVDFIGKRFVYGGGNDIGFANSPTHGTALLKLHGDVEKGIVLPTWSKRIEEDSRKVWGFAAEVLQAATQIRFVGYSLPTSDTYVQYLLKSAAIKGTRLKTIDVLCLDDGSKSVEGRYNEFVNVRNLRFKRGRTEEYLARIANAFPTGGGYEPLRRFDDLEYMHEDYFRHS